MPKQLIVLAISIVAAYLLAQPAPALTAVAQPNLANNHESVIQTIGQRRCYRYRDGRRVYHPCAARSTHKHKPRSGSYGTRQGSGYVKPWGGYEPCANCPTAR